MKVTLLPPILTVCACPQLIAGVTVPASTNCTLAVPDPLEEVKATFTLNVAPEATDEGMLACALMAAAGGLGLTGGAGLGLPEPPPPPQAASNKEKPDTKADSDMAFKTLNM